MQFCFNLIGLLAHSVKTSPNSTKPRITFQNRLNIKITEFVETWPAATALQREKTQTAVGTAGPGQGQHPHPPTQGAVLCPCGRIMSVPLGAQGNSMHRAPLAALSSGKAAQPSSTSPALGRDTDGLGDDRLTWRPQPSPAQPRPHRRVKSLGRLEFDGLSFTELHNLSA